MYSWIDAISLLVMGLSMAVAAVIDHRTLRIPNRLTVPLIVFGLALLAARCASGTSLFLAGATVVISYIFVYGLWRLGLWGGGDAKLVLALFILVSPAYPRLLFLVAYSVCLAIILLAKHVLFRGTKKGLKFPGHKPGPLSAEDIASIDEQGAHSPMGPSLFLAYVLSVMSLSAVPIA